MRLPPAPSLAPPRSHLIHSPLTRLASLPILVLALLFAACSDSAARTPPGATPPPSPGAPIPTATGTPAAPPPHAFAWFQYDSARVPQIWASINGTAATQITHIAPDHADCPDQIAWSPPIFSPDLIHIVAALGSFNCGDGAMTGPLSIITVSTGANYVRLNQRVAGWRDNSAIWYLTYSGLRTYSLGAASSSLTLSLTAAEEGTLRGATFFWSAFAGAGVSGAYSLHRYDLSSHSALPGAISLGAIPGCQCSPGDYRTPGWDVSADGAHIAYQVTTASSSGLTSQFFYANTDGSGARRIASFATASSFARIQLAPNDRLVAVSAAQPAPSVFSASVTSPGNNGDPDLRFYTPDAVSFPVWKWDSSQFWAASKDDTEYNPPSPGAILNFPIGGTSRIAAAGAYNPWYTIAA